MDNIYQIDLTKGNDQLTNLYTFQFSVNHGGNLPQGLILSKDEQSLYGTTVWGGENSHEEIFQLTL